MDPNEALKLLRLKLQDLRTLNDDPEAVDIEVADLFDGLDRWLSSGGFLPADWRQPPSPAPGVQGVCVTCGVTITWKPWEDGRPKPAWMGGAAGYWLDPWQQRSAYEPGKPRFEKYRHEHGLV